jgi:dTDP-L-rhamnose 4-epimerase
LSALENPAVNSRILITGGAGFIGSHLADELLVHGYHVRVLDNLSPQVHGAERGKPTYLDPDVELKTGDIRDPVALRQALTGVEAVYHFAASVGVGQSMYRVAEYCSVNDLGTAVLLEALLQHPVKKLIVASSMSIYGEGLYRDSKGIAYERAERTLEQLKAGDWELRNSEGEALTALPTPETKLPFLASVYALSKYTQERMSLLIGKAYGIPTVALRFFNVYGPRQALSNPYTGVLAIFASRILNGNRPLIYEDGRQKRDFVSVHDIARACRLALETPQAAGCVFNVGSGCEYSILEIAKAVAGVLGQEELRPQITGRYRMGDIRHCFADLSLTRSVLQFEPRVTLKAGLVELADWLEEQVAVDRVAEAGAELEIRGLTV